MGAGASWATSAFQAYATASLKTIPANAIQEEMDKMEVSDWLELDMTSRWKYIVFFLPPNNIVLNTFQTHFQLIRHTFCFTSTFSQKIRALFLVTVYTTVTRDSAPLVVSTTILQRQPS